MENGGIMLELFYEKEKSLENIYISTMKGEDVQGKVSGNINCV